MITKRKLISIKNNTAVFELLSYGEIKEYYFDYIIISLGTRANKELIDEIKSNFYTIRVIGDAKNPGRIRNAMETGFESAYNL